MKMQDMITWFEDRGFKATKEYKSNTSSYIFRIEKNDVSVEGTYLYNPSLSSWAANKAQTLFLSNMILKYNAAVDEYKKEEVKNNMDSRSSFPVIAAENNEGWLQIGNIKYPVKITDLTVSTDGTDFRGTVIDPISDYIKYDTTSTMTTGQWLKENPYVFGRKNGKTLYLKQMMNAIYGAPLTIEKVIFNPPATIVLWSDGTKTVVKAQGYDEYDPEKGLAMAICKKVMGNKGNYNNEINKWTDQYWEKRNEEVDWLYDQFPDITEFLHCSPDEAVAKFKKDIDELLYKKIFNKPESDVK